MKKTVVSAILITALFLFGCNSMNDVDIKNVATLRYQLYKYKAGEVVTVSYLRGGSSVTTRLTLGSQ